MQINNTIYINIYIYIYYIYYMNNYRYSVLCEMTRLVWGELHWYKIFLILTLFSISSAQWSIKNISKSFFRVAMSFIKTIEFGNVKFPKSISSEDGV